MFRIRISGSSENEYARALRLLAEVRGALAVVHIAYEDAAVDQNGVGRFDALVVEVHRQRRRLAERFAGKVHHRDLLRRDLLAEARAGNGAAEHEVCLDRVADCLMRDHAAELAAEDDGLHAGVRVDTLALLHKFRVKPVDLLVEQRRIGEVLVERAEPADRQEEFHGCAGSGFGAHHDVNIAALQDRAAGERVRGEELLLHRIGPDDERAALQILAVRGDIVVERTEEIDVLLLRGIGDLAVEMLRAAGSRRKRRRSFGSAAIHERSVFGSGDEDAARRVFGRFRLRREAADASLPDARGNAGDLAPGVADKVAADERDTARAVELRAQLGGGTRREIRSELLG